VTASPRNLARATALLILLTGLPALKYPISFVTNFSAYDNPAGLIMAVGNLVPLVLIAGTIMLMANRSIGYPLIYFGILFSIVGTTWSYIPFLPWLFEEPEIRFIAILVGNFVVLLFLFWCHFRERRLAQQSNAV